MIPDIVISPRMIRDIVISRIMIPDIIVTGRSHDDCIAQLYVPRQYKSFYLTIIDIIFYFVFNSQFNDFVFPIFTVTENNNENDDSV